MTQDRQSERLGVKVSFVAFPVAAEGKQPWHLAGEWRMPEAPVSASGRGAVLIVHGSAGVDSRGKSVAMALNHIGLATLEIDLWAARGVKSAMERPRSVLATLPDAFAALDFMADQPGIAPDRIGITGFSWGGVVSMLSANTSRRDQFSKSGRQFAAHAPLYPVCSSYNKAPGHEFGDLTGAPVMIQVGTADLYDDPDACARLVESLSPKDRACVTYHVYPDATHGWDRRETDMVVFDPHAHNGKGGEVPFTFNAGVAEKSTAALVSFFGKILGAAQ